MLMTTILLLEKRTYLLRIMRLFSKKTVLTTREIRKKIPSTTYYQNLVLKLLEINEILKSTGLEFFIRPIFLRENGVYLSGLERNNNIQIKIHDEFIAISYSCPQTK